MTYYNYCFCWDIAPRVGDILRYTTNNQTVSFGGNSYSPVGAVPYTIIQKRLGFSADNLEFVGSFNEDFTFRDVVSGKFIDARVKGYRVNVEDTTDFTLEFSGRLGQFTYNDYTFRTEVRSLSSVVSQSKGRVYTRNCPYKLGDGDCRVNTLAYTFSYAVDAVAGNLITLNLSQEDDYFAFGVAINPDGIEQPIRSQKGANIELWDKPLFSVGDPITLVAGCDKLRQTCKSKFNNVVNYGGFDLIPREDLITDVAVTGKSVYTGGSYFEPLD